MYGIFNITLDSQIPIPELPEVEGSSDTEVFKFSLGDNYDDKGIEWFHDWPDPKGDISISAGRDGNVYWLRFPGMVDFSIHLGDRSITAYTKSNTPDTTIRHLLLDQVIPRALGQQGHLILHAGSVSLVDGKTVAFIGQSGWGKSTLVSSFQQQGAELITDDCLMIDLNTGAVTAIPNYYGVRLFEDSREAIYGGHQQVRDVAHYSSKNRLILPGSNTDKSQLYTLDAIFLLSHPNDVNQPDQIELKNSGGAGAMMRLVAQTFVLDVTDKKLMARQFQQTGTIFDRKVRIYNLVYPRKHDILPDVHEAIDKRLNDIQ